MVKNFSKIDKNIKVKVGPSESMSKSKKNIIDPQQMIENYGVTQLEYLYYQTVLQKKIFNGL